MSSMQRYMDQLIEDIQESAVNKDTNSEQYYVPMPHSVPEHLRHLPVIPEQKAHQWFRLSPEMFPPAGKWNEYQLLYFCVLLRSLFEHYNIEVEIPHGLPYDKVYTFLIKALNEYTTCTQDHDSVNTISFCEGEYTTCPFGKHCTLGDSGYCDTWLIGHFWDGYVDLEEMEKNIDKQQ